jgi:ATP-binding cassette, subfamily B, bacterial
MTDQSQWIEDDTNAQRKVSLWAMLGYLWRHVKSQPGKISAVLVLMLLATACELALPIMAGAIVEMLADGPEAADQAFELFYIFAAFAAGMYVLRNILVRFWSAFSSWNMKNIVTEGFADVQRFSSQWHGDNFAGATVRRVSRAMWAYDTIADNIVWFVIPAVLVLGGLTGVMLIKWPLIGAYVGITILVFVVSVILLAKFFIEKPNALANSADTAIGAALADAVSANPTVKAFGAEGRELARFTGVVETWRALVLKVWFRFSDAWMVQNVLMWALQVGLLGLVLLEWKAGRASPGDAAFALTSYFLIASYLRNMGETVQTLQRGFADIEDVVAYSLEAEDIKDPATGRLFQRGAGQVVFDRVGFGYRGQDVRLYQDFSLTIAPGETVALVGQTGSGKSTFVKLLQRLYDVDEGAILIDGQDVRAVTQASLRAHIALVPQDPALFHRSLRENIAYARPAASLEEVRHAASRAHADEFISRLPKGYETEVGERGVKLSGGERQRVALARAFLADAPILILDEATSSLDNQTEADVQAAMAELIAGRTTILIAHRLSTVRQADRILVFDQGRVVEQGTHGELIAMGGHYARLNAISIGDHFEETRRLEPASVEGAPGSALMS